MKSLLWLSVAGVCGALVAGCAADADDESTGAAASNLTEPKDDGEPGRQELCSRFKDNCQSTIRRIVRDKPGAPCYLEEHNVKSGNVVVVGKAACDAECPPQDPPRTRLSCAIWN